MARDVRTALLILCGLLLIMAGLFQLLAFFPLSALGFDAAIALLIIVPGIILTALGLAKARPAWAIGLLALCSALLIAVSSGLTAFLTPGYYARLEERELTVADVPSPVEEVRVSVSTDVGAISVSTTENRTLLVAVKFRMAAEEKPTFSYELVGTSLTVVASARLSSVDITVASWLNWSARVRTGLGAIEASVNATNLVDLLLESSLGAISLAVEAPRLSNNCTIVVRTSLGSVDADVHLGAPAARPVGCEVEVKTSLGSIDLTVDGFEVASRDRGYLLLRSEGFEAAERVLYIRLSTSLGSIDVVARRP